MIEHDNIFYIRDLSELGGVETFTWELVKKFKDYDIAVVCKTANINQVRRMRKYCKVYRHTNEKIKCKTAIINYDVSIIDYIDDGADIYQVIHGDYENPAYKWKPPTHERIKKYIGITKHIVESFKRITGLDNVMLGYNPLSIEDEKSLILISGTRLSPVKGKDRMIKLAKALDDRGIKYLWLVFTNDKKEINSPNVVYMKPRLDIGCWMDKADYLVQLSDTEACSYSINEMLYRNKPVIVTPLPYLDEIGVKDGVNAYILDFDCSNIDSVVDRIMDIPKFEFKRLKDSYDKLIVKTPSHYKEDLEKDVKVRCVKRYDDMMLNRTIEIGEEIQVDRFRAEYLQDNGVVKIIE